MLDIISAIRNYCSESLINASNLYVGGGVQVAISVLEELSDSSFSFIAVVSPVVYSQLSDDAASCCIVIESSPSKLLNFKVRRQLDDIVKKMIFL